MTVPPDDRDPVDVLAEEFADRLRRGEHPSVSDYAAAHPTHADQLRDLLPAVAQMEYLKRFRRAAGLDPNPQLPDRFGDFRIVRELGRGGMGVVFEAMQESLGRPVALKVLATHAQLDDRRRERFVREAHAAARLHHTNIVPVFGVGEQDGIPYYVMQLIRGQGLNAIIHQWRIDEGEDEELAPPAGPSTVSLRKQPTTRSPRVTVPPPMKTHSAGDWEFIAEVGIQAAEALHYAHKQGILHRDVKPANLILDPSDRVWITDFGLAKLVELNGLTATGDILGTLQYLAPECLAGDADSRSDVYGLGATLYELLTLVPPYSADSPARLIKHVAENDPTPPSEIDPSIPRDLETIVLKAMAREPQHRYASARELARDLQAFLEDRPIKARRQTWLSRGWRWCRRNPAIAVLSINMIAALVLAAVVGWIGYARTQRALDAAEKKRDQAEKAQTAADNARHEAELASSRLAANLRLSLEAFEKVFDAAGGNRVGVAVMGWGPFERHGGMIPPPPSRRPGTPPFPGEGPPPGGSLGGPGAETADKASVLEAILGFYDKFAEQNATNPQLQLEAAKAHRRVGEAKIWLGQKEKGNSSFLRAIGLLEALEKKYPANPAFSLELVQTYLTAPTDVIAIDQETLLTRSLERLKSLDTQSHPFLAGLVTFRLGWERERAGNHSGAEEAYADAVRALAPQSSEADERPLDIVLEQAMARYCLTAMLMARKRYPEARRVVDESLAELHRSGERPGIRLPRDLMWSIFQQQAEVCSLLGDHAAAHNAWKEAERHAPPKGFGPKGPKK
jgi:serine/threonine protein kinase